MRANDSEFLARVLDDTFKIITNFFSSKKLTEILPTQLIIHVLRWQTSTMRE